ncbi:hypothetical protein [Pseudovibrio denitrificans]|nr:hypothetical protein [Pseudovibrio denitrificans]
MSVDGIRKPKTDEANHTEVAQRHLARMEVAASSGIGKPSPELSDKLSVSNQSQSERNNHFNCNDWNAYTVCRANTGWFIEDYAWLESNIKNELHETYTARLADILEAGGVSVRKETYVKTICLVTRKVRLSSQYRNCSILPAMARQKLATHKLNLDYWCKHERTAGSELLFFVATVPGVVPAFGELSESACSLSRCISKAAPTIRAEFGCDIVFRSTEFTRRTAEQRGSAVLDQYSPGTMTYHPHANVLIDCSRPLSMARRGKLLRYLRRALGTHVKDCGPIADTSYVTKFSIDPKELLGSNEVTPDEATWLFRELHRINRLQPMGAFKDWCAELGESNYKVAEVRLGGARELVLMDITPKRSRDEGEAQSRREADQTCGEACEREATETLNGDSRARNTKPLLENIILGITKPTCLETQWAAPRVIVIGYTEDPQTEGGKQRLEKINHMSAAVLVWWYESGAPLPEEALAQADELRTEARLSSSSLDINFNCPSTATRKERKEDTNAPGGRCP